MDAKKIARRYFPDAYCEKHYGDPRDDNGHMSWYVDQRAINLAAEIEDYVAEQLEAAGNALPFVLDTNHDVEQWLRDRAAELRRSKHGL